MICRGGKVSEKRRARRGRLYVAAVVDIFCRRVVGWSMHAARTEQLVTDALVGGHSLQKCDARALRPLPPESDRKRTRRGVPAEQCLYPVRACYMYMGPELGRRRH